MKWIKRIALGAAVLILLLLAVVAAALYVKAHPKIYRFPARVAGTLTEVEAIAVAREAITASGYNPQEYAPFAWGTREWGGKPERILARNTINPNDGYVVWHHASGGPGTTLYVYIDKRDRTCACTVGKGR